VTPADVMGNAPMLPPLRRAIFRRRVRPTCVIADTTYGTADNIRELEESGIRAYVPLPVAESQHGGIAEREQLRTATVARFADLRVRTCFTPT